MITHESPAPARRPIPTSAQRDIGPRRLAAHAVACSAVLYAVVVVWVTLRPVAWATEGAEHELGILSPGAWIDPASWIEGRPLEVAANVVMFLPIGAATGFLHRGRARFVLPLALTLAIELAQIPLDRISHPRDLLANALGAILGVALAAAAGRRSRPRATERATG